MIHVIDAVLTPPSISHNLVDTVVADDRLGTLVTALKAVDGLVDALAGDGPFTVFGTLCGDDDSAVERTSCQTDRIASIY